MSQTSLSISKKREPLSVWKAIVFLAVAVLGLYYVKWNPYFHKAILAATEHDIGFSILGSADDTMAGPSWSAAWEYAAVYFRSVWKAAVLGIVLGSLVQILIPKDWLMRVLGGRPFGSTVAGGTAALPGMMCSCCAAPVAVGIRKQNGSIGAALAFWIGNPVLNPATIIFMGFVLDWQFAILRICAGMLLVFGVCYWADRLIKEDTSSIKAAMPPLVPENSHEQGSIIARWFNTLWQLFWSVVPAYLLSVLVLGTVRAWLFPVIGPEFGSGVLAIIFLALAGTLFVIPTAAEIPMVKTMMTFGLGVGPAAALIMTLPAVSLPSLLMVRKAFPAKALWFVTGMVVLFGIVSGLVAMIVM